LELRRTHRWRPLADEPQVADDPEANPELDIEPGRLSEALGTLSLEHREVLVLRVLRDMAYAEIAAVTGTPIGTVRSRPHYARAALRAILKEKPNV
jgi:RNA polymerase sigma-70 factor (ECF subfamily)